MEEIFNYSPVEETNLENGDFRLGLLFVNKSNREIYSMYFSTISPEVRIRNKMFMAPKGLLESIAPFIPDQSQEYFEKQINSWFAENSKEESN